MAFHRVEMELAGRTLSIETGKIAKQAQAAVLVQFGETVILGTVVHAAPREGIDFFPLTVDYREKLSAAGKFPGGFRKREGAPSQKEILTMRNIDRPLRPLFPHGFIDEVQIQCWVMAADGQNEPDVLAGIAASAALAISGIPFDGPVGNVRVARIDGQLVAMPTAAQNDYSDLDMLLCGHEDGLNMIEVGSDQIPEAEMAEAIEFGHGYIKQIVGLIKELQSKAAKPMVDFASPVSDEVRQKVDALAGPLKAAKTTEGSKLERAAAVKACVADFLAEQFPEPAPTAGVGEYNAWKKSVGEAKFAIHDLEEQITREIIRSGSRTDGRSAEDLRKIEGEVGLFPRVHGSALFTRGETQALVTAVIGSGKDEQIVDGLGEEYTEKFYLHYNFPPFSVGEAKRITGPGRREIGHGMLAQKALMPVLPPVEDFPYTVRLVSDITESNGSSSMASACGGSLALLDAGVPILAPVAGISIGMISADEPGQDDVYLVDIQGEEDHFGDMDFKVTGTETGITAIQLDLKTRGLTMEQIRTTFDKARAARLKILETMNAAISGPKELSEHAPRMLSVKINPEKIGKLIGPGGKNIRALEENTGATLTIEEDGTVFIAAVGAGKAEAALEEVEKIAAEVKVGSYYNGRVAAIKDFGAFIEVIPGQDGLCHISELSDGFVKQVTDIVKVGDEVRVKVILIDDQGRVKLSRKAVLEEEKQEETSSTPA
ncbi:polyribonucleotide nucleotidyltransferase [Mucisphaera calidilacus]|uniref:Polyribonucleotide nucleotidyltransferase n=1 Tax=Mucisphaera calidilacus TaxID=2527982 RepID=A0A518BW12_9BACT|nr:polyribonucleotide nucleotidyltransferase [Mucisphaera calidilacus]QDU71151.1 Polyribonucleotide nucleotidyltransferase [Mucisphaera calidilacus]